MRLGPYRLLEELDRKGVTAAWRAVHEELGRAAIVKALRPAASPTSAFARAIEREAAALARLDDDAVVRLYDFERGASGPYVALEDPGGATLAEVLAKATRLAPEVAAAVVLGAARGVGHAHARGVVHRDLSPRALALTPAGAVKVGDFGAAHVEGAADTADAVEAPGRPDYMAPEQILGEPAAPPADVFSLGVVLYEAIAGARPFASQGPESTDVARRIRSAAATPLRDLVPGVPRALERVALRCLAKRPEERFADGLAVADALDAVLAELASPPPASLVVRALAAARLAPEPTGAQVAPRARRPTAGLASLAPELRVLLLLLAALVLGVFGLDRAFEGPSRRASRTAPAARAPAGSRGHLRVLARPWAEVVLDGELVDVTPIGRPIPVAPGRHYLTFRHPAAPDEQRTVDVAAAQTVLLDVTMRVARAPRAPDAGAPRPSPSASP